MIRFNGLCCERNLLHTHSIDKKWYWFFLVYIFGNNRWKNEVSKILKWICKLMLSTEIKNIPIANWSDWTPRIQEMWAQFIDYLWLLLYLTDLNNNVWVMWAKTKDFCCMSFRCAHPLRLLCRCRCCCQDFMLKRSILGLVNGATCFCFIMYRMSYNVIPLILWFLLFACDICMSIWTGTLKIGCEMKKDGCTQNG